MDKRILGRNIKKAREKCGLTKKGLAMKAGLSPNMIKSIEQGRHALSAQLIISIAEVIETDPVDLTKGAIGLSESDEQLMKDLTRKKVKTKKIRYGFAILIQ